MSTRNTKLSIVAQLEQLDLTTHDGLIEANRQLALFCLAGFPTEVVGKNGPVELFIRQPNVAATCLREIHTLLNDRPKSPPAITVNVNLAVPGDYDQGQFG